MRSLPAFLLLALALAGCSDPDSGLSDRRFYARAAETRSGFLGGGPNAWNALQRALDAHGAILEQADARAAPGDTLPSLQIDALSYGALPRPGLGDAAPTIAEIERAGLFPALDAALNAGPLWAPWDESLPVFEGYRAGFTHLGQLRSLQRTLRARARLSALEGDTDETLRCLRRQLGLSRAAGGRALSIDYLTAIAMLTTTLQDVRHLALEGLIDGPTADAILGLLDETWLPPAQAVLDTERDFTLATFVVASREAGIEIARKRWLDEIRLVHAESGEALTRSPRAPVAEIDDEQLFGALLAGASTEEASLRLMRLGFAAVVDNERLVRLDLAGTRAVLLLARHHAEHGSYPATLDAIDAPTDPITGGPFVYRHTPEDPLGRPFELYSTGADGADNGGVAKPAEGVKPPSPDDAGFDYPLTLPRRPLRS